MSETNLQNQAQFKASLNDLFDIAHRDALSLIKIPEDKEFLIAQQETGRKGKMGALDKKASQMASRKQKQSEAEAKRPERED